MPVKVNLLKLITGALAKTDAALAVALARMKRMMAVTVAVDGSCNQKKPVAVALCATSLTVCCVLEKKYLPVASWAWIGTKKCSCTVFPPTTRVCVRTFLPLFPVSLGRVILLAMGAAIG